MIEQEITSLDASQSGGAFVSKASQIRAIDRFWAIEDSYSHYAVGEMETLSIADALELQAAFDAAKSQGSADSKPYEMTGGTAVIPISGPMTKNPTSMSYLFGGTATTETIAVLKKAASDPQVKNAVLLFDTPGGQVDGTAELADVVRGFPKPIVSFNNGSCCSAGTWVATQANAGFFSTKNASNASVGVKTVIRDTSKAATARGIKVIPVTSGELKSIGEPGTAVTEPQIAHVQGLIDGIFSEFKAAVQTGRAMDDETFAKLADGRVVLPPEALEIGLIDGICSFEECLRLLNASSTVSAPGAASSTPLPTQQEGHDPATAQTRTATTQETNMNLKEVIARFKKVEPTALAQAGLDADALDSLTETEAAATPQPDPRLTAMLAEQGKIANAAIHREANAFWSALITPDKDGKAKATWSQKDGVIATFVTLAQTDAAGGSVFAEDGSFAVGANLKRYMDAMNAAESNALQAEELKNQDPKGTSAQQIRPDVIHKAAKGRLGKDTADRLVASIEGGQA